MVETGEQVGELLIEVTVKDTKSSWGKIRVQIEPVAGIGLQWVELSSLMPDYRKANSLTFTEIE